MPYLGYYPVGAFVTQDKRSLGPLVQRLRAAGRLKPGRNVTPFSITCLRCTRFDADRDGTSLEESCRANLASLRLRHFPLNTTEDEGLEPNEASSSLEWLMLTVRSLLSDRVGPLPASHLDSFLYSLGACDTHGEVETAFSFGTNEKQEYFAVHVVGAWSTEELEEILCPESATGAFALPLGYIHQLRVYSQACCPVPALPPEIARLRAIACSQKTDIVHSSGIASGTHASGRKFSFSELFSGIGMFRLGLEKVGGRSLFAVERSIVAQTVYCANFECCSPNARGGKDPIPDTLSFSPLVGDITEIPSAFFPSHDILTAGFPCQSFSKAGPSTGLHGPQGWLFYEVVRVIYATRPRLFLLENVENLVCVENGDQLEEIMRWLRGGNGRSAPQYVVQNVVLDGAIVTPQTRHRVYFLGIRADVASGVVLSTVIDSVNDFLRDAVAHRPFGCVRDLLIETLPDPQAVAEGVSTEEQLRTLVLTDAQWRAVQRSRYFLQRPMWRIADVTGHSRTLMGSYRHSYQLYSEFVPYPSCLSREELLERIQQMALPDPSQMDHRELRMVQEEEAQAQQSHSPPLRFFAARECARLQGIPDNYVFPTSARGAVYKLIGNAVNPVVIECFGKAIAQCVPLLSLKPADGKSL